MEILFFLYGSYEIVLLSLAERMRNLGALYFRAVCLRDLEAFDDEKTSKV